MAKVKTVRMVRVRRPRPLAKVERLVEGRPVGERRLGTATRVGQRVAGKIRVAGKTGRRGTGRIRPLAMVGSNEGHRGRHHHSGGGKTGSMPTTTTKSCATGTWRTMSWWPKNLRLRQELQAQRPQLRPHKRHFNQLPPQMRQLSQGAKCAVGTAADLTDLTSTRNSASGHVAASYGS